MQNLVSTYSIRPCYFSNFITYKRSAMKTKVHTNTHTDRETERQTDRDTNKNLQ